MNRGAPPAVLADNCGSLSDCFSNNLLPALLVVLGLVALVALAWYAWPVLLRLAAGPSSVRCWAPPDAAGSLLR